MKLRMVPVLKRLDHDPRDEGGDERTVVAIEFGDVCPRYQPGDADGARLSFLRLG